MDINDWADDPTAYGKPLVALRRDTWRTVLESLEFALSQHNPNDHSGEYLSLNAAISEIRNELGVD